MTLTPKPLTHTAHEFYAMQYDRKADPNAPFWKRKTKKEAYEPPEADIVHAAPETVEPDIVETETAEPQTKSEVAPEPPAAQAEPLEAEAVQTNPPAGEVETIDPSSDPMPDPKPTSSGSVH